MANVDNIRNDLIDRILMIRNENFLIALDKLIASSSSENDTLELTKEQELMLQMSEADIQNGRIISQNDLKTKTTAWLKDKKSQL